VHREENDTAMDVLADEIRQSKARRGASPTDPLTKEEAANLADMKRILEDTKKCKDASELALAHAAEAQRRAVHSYVDGLKKQDK